METKLGLHMSPDKTEYLFVGEAESDEGATPWYKMDFENNRQIPVAQDALTGYIYNIVITSAEFKGKVNYKLNLYVRAEHKYVIRTGAGTTFSRGLVLSLHKILKADSQALIQPMTITASHGQEDSKVTFCGIYSNGEKIIPEWNTESLSDKIEFLQKAMGQIVQTKEMMDDKALYWEAVKEKQAPSGKAVSKSNDI
jgi:hypothetical protein